MDSPAYLGHTREEIIIMRALKSFIAIGKKENSKFLFKIIDSKIKVNVRLSYRLRSKKSLLYCVFNTHQIAISVVMSFSSGEPNFFFCSRSYPSGDPCEEFESVAKSEHD